MLDRLLHGQMKLDVKSFFITEKWQSVSHLGETDDWPRMSRTKDVLNDFFVCYQDFSEYVGL